MPGNRFRFLNEEHGLDDGGWDSVGQSKLWRYNLHYFDDLNASEAQQRRAEHVSLVSRWIKENPPGKGTAWEPYPTSLRIVNWIKWLQICGQPGSSWLESLALQARWLRRRMEWHLLGNHLFTNAKALFIAGVFFEGDEADDWRRVGGRILIGQLEEQVLRDGGQFERSPMYHLLALEDVLDLLLFIHAYGMQGVVPVELQSLLWNRATMMLSWASIMQFEDGCLPRLNDSADGIAPAFPELLRVAAFLGLNPPAPAGVPLHVLADTGYARVQWDGALAFIDVAPIGPDYLPGHAHADTLSFELAIAGRAVIVNRGTSCYGISERRSWERGTAAHSTVEVGGQNSSETWGGFRVGRRARVRVIRCDDGCIEAEHDGYRHLPGRPVHRRSWSFLPRAMRVSDAVNEGFPAVARYHFAPGVKMMDTGNDTWTLYESAVAVATVRVVRGSASVVQTQHAAGFGILIPAQTLEVQLDAGQSIIDWAW